MSNGMFNSNPSVTYIIDPRYRPMQEVVRTTPTANHQVVGVYQAGAQANPQQIYYMQNSPNPLPLQQNQNYINYAHNHAQIGTHTQNHAQNPVQKRVKLSHPEETPAKICKESSPQIVLQKRAQRPIRGVKFDLGPSRPSHPKHLPRAPGPAKRLRSCLAKHLRQPPVTDQADEEPDPSTTWKQSLKHLVDDVVFDGEDGYSPEFHMKVLAATSFIDELLIEVIGLVRFFLSQSLVNSSKPGNEECTLQNYEAEIGPSEGFLRFKTVNERAQLVPISRNAINSAQNYGVATSSFTSNQKCMR
ncbi:uncharacterized protein MELLADRAFT_112015 [Melampsora larici-populina 98AG31]|uniref:Uncharacterized protein n=1 Tax=Melampsora larici-populina (strain 98AG31 / pathotype 3-4-7) TaxID=747676 RepID=F4S540_MELLP|nr:uncharacterized protein MELLADRAFT_112015 [Melampsora larici-populina 98AG31]EGG00254.1 hypothetical protein MELLADRAFT_112015 [Melampsora larici-populina 98AG31]